MVSKPLVTHIYTADPSAHVFNSRLYIYPSHDRETDITFNDNGDQYDMTDYHVLSMDHMGGLVTDHGVVLRASDIPWVSKQLWAPDATSKDGKYFLYFPARDKNGIFRIGVAVANTPVGPFVPEENYIPGSYSIDPAVFVDKPDGEQTSKGADGKAYIYFGGLWGGQLQCWVRPTADSDKEKTDVNGYIFDDSQSGSQEPSGPGMPALCPRVAQLSDDMRGFVFPARETQILAPETGKPIAADDHERRFFEAAWRHGCIATEISPTSRTRRETHITWFMRRPRHGVRLRTADGFRSLCWGGRRITLLSSFGAAGSLFYHDCELSRGVEHLRSVKVREIVYDDEGGIHLA